MENSTNISNDPSIYEDSLMLGHHPSRLGGSPDGAVKREGDHKESAEFGPVSVGFFSWDLGTSQRPFQRVENLLIDKGSKGTGLSVFRDIKTGDYLQNPFD